MKFRTELTPQPLPSRIGLKDKILALGSCFAVHLGQYLEANKFNILLNPFGTIYNPVSLFKVIRLSLENRMPSDSLYIENMGVSYHFDFHSELSALSRAELEKKIRENIARTHMHLRETRFMILTFGTAFVYTERKSGQIVANCHKVPASDFSRDLLSQKQILQAFEELYQSLPDTVQVLLTVSPVRHIRDTLELNAVSKSTLRLCCHTAANTFDRVHYFPSYELMLDDLRDYRYYTDDLLHPSTFARQYIWEKFKTSCLDQDANAFIKEWEAIQRDLAHKPFQPGAEAHRTFLEGTLKKLQRISGTVDVSDEMNMIQKQLHEKS